MRNELNILMAIYAGVTLILALVALGVASASAWASLWACAACLAIVAVARIGYAIYDAGRRSADKEER